MKRKIIKIKIGSVYIDGTNHSVFTEAWEQIDKKGNTYFKIVQPVFINEVEVEDNENKKDLLQKER